MTKTQLWGGRILSGIPILFLLMDAGMKIAKAKVAVDGMKELGYLEELIVPLGIVLLLSTILYAVPRTAFIGAILLTGYLGGAVATHVRVGNPMFTHVLFPVYVGVMVWAGLVLRDARLRAAL